MLKYNLILTNYSNKSNKMNSFSFRTQFEINIRSESII